MRRHAFMGWRHFASCGRRIGAVMTLPWSLCRRSGGAWQSSLWRANASPPGGGETGSGGGRRNRNSIEQSENGEDEQRCDQTILITGNLVRYSGELANYMGTLIATGGAIATVVPGGQKVGVGLFGAGAALSGVGTI